MDFMTCPALSHTNITLCVLDTVDTDAELTVWGRETQEVVKWESWRKGTGRGNGDKDEVRIYLLRVVKDGLTGEVMFEQGSEW